MIKELWSLLDSLKKAGETLKGIIEENGNTVQLLADMQEAAVAIGTEIEKLEGPNNRAVRLLETYCELLWNCSQAETEGEALQLLGKIQETLYETCQFLEKEEKKSQIVFFPYKASMWDSMESIWKAAKEREDCRVYVVPIPYYDKDNNGFLGEMHNEAEAFPKEVPIVSYKDYVPEAQRPDVVFIHNPYDSYNAITMVHPTYHAKHLASCTNMLVYVPYFVLGERMPKEFAMTSGVVFSHRVILQSETARQIYIKGFKEAIKTGVIKKCFSEEEIQNRFLALGSPKIDIAVNGKREDYRLPIEWRDLLKKKAVLYNTGISGVFDESRQFLSKVEDTLEYFRERTDVILWWRPHPQVEEMIRFMSPNLLEKYRELVKKYREAAYGIYDTTPELHRAVAYTDMYYGDNSSIINLFGVQGKPIMRQNYYVRISGGSFREEKSIISDCGIYEKDKFYFFSACYNALFELNLSSGDTAYLGSVPGEEMVEPDLYSHMISCDDDLWLIPNHAKEIARYSRKEKCFVKYPLSENPTSQAQKIYYAYLQKPWIYMISWDYKKMYRFSVEEGLCIEESLELDGAEDILGICRRDARLNMQMADGKLYGCICDSNRILEWNPDNRCIRIYTIGNETNKYSQIIYDGVYFWLIPYAEGNIVRWDKRYGEIREISDYPSEFYAVYRFSAAVCQGAYLWVFPAWGKISFKIHRDTMKIEETRESEMPYAVFAVQSLKDGSTAISLRTTMAEQSLVILGQEGRFLKHPIKKAECFQYEKEQVFSRLHKESYATCLEYTLFESQEVNLSVALDNLVQSEAIFEKERDCYRRSYENGNGTAGNEILKVVLEAIKEK